MESTVVSIYSGGLFDLNRMVLQTEMNDAKEGQGFMQFEGSRVM